MDDVDRLFECFKCGVTPPESAIRERKTSVSRLKPENSSVKGTDSPSSARQGEKKTVDVCGKSESGVSVTNKTNKLIAGRQLSPGVFYGSPHGVPPKRPSSLLRVLREIHLDLSERRKSNLRKQIWATFPKQDDAIKFAKEQANVRIFSYQDHFSGQRRFLVSTYQEFWRRYKNMDSKSRHHYEVIQDGFPCHLYFDLEFNRLENTNRDGNQMVDLLLLVIFEALHEKYHIQGEEDWVVELDSSTEAKFSRHLVLRIPKAAFKDNSHAGAFVSELFSRIHKAKEKDERFHQLFILKDSSSAGPSMQLFVDNAVYSRNRCFRLALSSKAGKTSLLLPTGRFKCKGMCEEDVFMASLICNIDDDCEKLLVCKMELDCIKTLQFDTEVNITSRRPLSALQEFTSNACRNDASRTYLMGASPFPALDAFIESVASFGAVTGKIRSWYWFSEYSLLVYSMSKSRYCGRIGREHKSNHVMYVADLQWALYYQKCYDPDCQGYRSPSRPIPLDLIPEVSSLENTGVIDGSDNNKEHMLLGGHESMIDGDNDESWWLEAVKAADNVETMGDLFISTTDNDNEDDEGWWMEVERTASQAELNCHC
ncbi:DNA-directed primase/polymerase protein-like [Chenopodium quinoa]|uniref:DNA-directed primase/polymerase protein n=1 Tax=Chenopodium quinoa TaxID=63459 RepID=A0A803M056_CHEQI|nr:DNA-directed primase/polymerase protein-like [Chenopodium quinoa]